MSAQPSVLFDAPGPRTVVRHRLYSLVTLLAVLGVLAWMYLKFDAAGQFEPQIYERLASTNVWREIQDALGRTLRAAAISIVTALVVGVLLAVARLSDHPVVRMPATAFVQFFRAVPLVLLIIFAYGALRRYAPGLDDAIPLLALVIGLTLYNGSVLAEVFRAGILAVPRGQSEAAYAIGMRKTQVMSIVLIPQAVKFMLPAIISQCVVVLKDTSLGYVVVYGPELVRSGRAIADFADSFLMTYLLVALIFIALNSVLSILATWLERRLSRSRTGAKAVERVEDVLPVG